MTSHLFNTCYMNLVYTRLVRILDDTVAMNNLNHEWLEVWLIIWTADDYKVCIHYLILLDALLFHSQVIALSLTPLFTAA